MRSAPPGALKDTAQPSPRSRIQNFCVCICVFIYIYIYIHIRMCACAHTHTNTYLLILVSDMRADMHTCPCQSRSHSGSLTHCLTLSPFQVPCDACAPCPWQTEVLEGSVPSCSTQSACCLRAVILICTAGPKRARVSDRQGYRFSLCLPPCLSIPLSSCARFASSTNSCF